jgi:MFS transporter, PAT family, beta-lactamase induction signal transducer AmpG
MSEVDLEQVAGLNPSSPEERQERPWLFGLFIAPNAVLANGIISGVLSYLLRQQGVSIGRSSEIISLLILPQTIYFLWSPITDFWVRRRTWLIVGAAASALTMAAAFHGRRLDTPSAVALMFLSACFGQLIVSSCGGMMGTLHSEANRRKAGSSYQGGSLAFGALGVFVLALLAERIGMGPLGWIAAALIALPAFAALAAPEQPREQGQGIAQTFTCIWDEFKTTFLRWRIAPFFLLVALFVFLAIRMAVGLFAWIVIAVSALSALVIPLVRKRPTFICIWHEFKTTFLRWRAIPYTLLMIFPMGSGAAIGLFPGIAQDYHVSGHQMAWMNGMAGALLMAAGSLAATLIPARIRASVGYLSVCLLNAATLVILWLGPLSPSTYFVGSTLYLFTIGSCYAMFTAVVLEFLGQSGKSGCGRYSIINSLGNVPVVYMTALDGRGGKLWGARGLAGTDAVVGAIGAAILLTYFLTRKRTEARVPAYANAD